MESSAVTAGAVSRVADDPAPLSRKSFLRNFGVIARCRFGGSPMLSKALKRAVNEGSSREPSGT